MAAWRSGRKSPPWRSAQAQNRAALFHRTGRAVRGRSLRWSTPNVLVQETFADYDVPWRKDFVCGWDLWEGGGFRLPTGPGLGIELDRAVLAAHPPQKNPFPSLWDSRWLKDFTRKNDRG